MSDAYDMSGDFRQATIYIKSSVQGGPEIRIPLQRPPRAQYFTDRKRELAQLLVDLQPGQVVTLCGPGGIGKTTLAAEAIWTLVFGDGRRRRGAILSPSLASDVRRWTGGLFCHYGREDDEQV